MRRLLILAICALIFTASAAAEAVTPAERASMDKRTRAFVGMLSGCRAGASLALSLAQKAGNDLIEASGNVSKAKGICDTVHHNMAGGDTLHFRDQAVKCQVAVDYYSRGLGRLLDYIDNALPSDGAKAVEYFQDGTAWSRTCVREVNQRRAVYKLKALPL